MINTTQFTNMSGDIATGTMQGLNNSSDGVFGFMLLLTVYCIFFMGMLRWGVKAAFSATAFICAILAILLRLMDLIYDPVLYGAIILAIIGLVIVFMDRN